MDNPSLSLSPAGANGLRYPGLGSGLEVVEVVYYQDLDAWWYMEDVESECDELVVNRPVGICKIQQNYV